MVPVLGGSGGAGESVADFRFAFFVLFAGHGRLKEHGRFMVWDHWGEGVEGSH
jgi:hypothetical protein